jgi:archaellum component FlaC
MNEREQTFYEHVYRDVTVLNDVNCFDTLIISDTYADIPIQRRKEIIESVKNDIADIYDIHPSQLKNLMLVWSYSKDLKKTTATNKFREKLEIEKRIQELEQLIYNVEEEYETRYNI